MADGKLRINGQLSALSVDSTETSARTLKSMNEDSVQNIQIGLVSLSILAWGITEEKGFHDIGRTQVEDIALMLDTYTSEYYAPILATSACTALRK